MSLALTTSDSLLLCTMSCSYIGVLSSRNLPLSHFPPASLVLAKEHQLLTNSWQRGKINDCLVFILPPNSEVFFILPASGKGPRDYSVFLVAFFLTTTLFSHSSSFSHCYLTLLCQIIHHTIIFCSHPCCLFSQPTNSMLEDSHKKKRDQQPTIDGQSHEELSEKLWMCIFWC